MSPAVNRRAEAAAELAARMGHDFRDRSLFERALTHSSAGHGARKVADNERLEFLGDRVLGLIIADALHARAPNATAGELSKRQAGLVSRTACARAARDLDLGPALRMPGGETRRGGREHETILADACEAVIAAVYLDAGLEAARALVLKVWAPMFDEPVDLAAANPKSALQEWAAAAGRPPPAYDTVERSGPDHQPRFRVRVSLSGETAVEGEGGSVQAAQKAAALTLLSRVRALHGGRP